MATTEVLFNPLLPEFHANPYPFYHQLPRERPRPRDLHGLLGPHPL